MIKNTMKIQTQFDINKMIEVYTEYPNYKILNFDNHSNKCVIYFSSNGLYYPNTNHVFEREIIKKNRFEWEKNILKSAKKVIFIRDITKQWYLTGINSEINTIGKLFSFLHQETLGLEVICVGGSAGGYAATLFGSLLKAKCIFNFSGQFCLDYILDDPKDPTSREKNLTLVKYENNIEYRQYYSIIDIVKNNNVPIFYFYPARCTIDIFQNELVRSIDNVYQFPFKSTAHGKTCYIINFVDLFDLESKQIIELCLENKHNEIRPIDFSIRVSGLQKTAKYLGLYLPSMTFKKIVKLATSKIFDQ
jgi:hypothetical protein